jgi:hypothetical protein
MNALPTRKAQELAHDFHAPMVADDTSIMATISRAASDPNVNVDKLERLVALKERSDAKEAEREFNIAMNKVQEEIRPIAADASNPQTRSKYASYLALDKALRPIYTKHGFNLSFDTGDAARPEEVRVLCYAGHDAGHSRTYKVDMPADGKGAKGGDVMTKTHATGAAMTYGQRYLLKMIFNIAVGDDDDGNKAGDTNAKITAEQAETIRELIDRSGSDIEKFCTYFKVEAVPELKAKDYARAVAAINLREKKATGK